MKTSLKKIIRFDYLSKLLFLIAVISIVLLIGIVSVGELSVVGIILPVVIVSVALVVLRALAVKKVLDRIINNQVQGTVTGTMRNNGNFYVSLSYEFNGETYNKRVILLIGPILRLKLEKMKTMNLLIDDTNPKKAYISDLYLK